MTLNNGAGMEFEHVIAPLELDAFLASHWEKSWLHLLGTSDRFADLLSWDDQRRKLELVANTARKVWG